MTATASGRGRPPRSLRRVGPRRAPSGGSRRSPLLASAPSRSAGNIVATLLVALLLVGFAALVVLALAGRAQRDAYPPYSSLRTDPSGASLFFDGLARAGLAVARQYDPGQLATLAPASVTCFYVASGELSADTAQALFGFVIAGGRLVLLQPAPPEPPAWVKKLQAQAKAKTPPPKVFVPPTLWRLLGLSLHPYSHAGAFSAAPAPSAAPTTDAALWPLNPAGLGLPSLPIATDGYLDLHDPGWQPVYLRARHPVMATRRFGRGSVVVASDALFTTNQVVRAQPAPQLMLWLVGGRPQVLVDESEHGVQYSYGLAWLFRRYRLEAGLLGLVILFALAVWRLAPALLPPAPKLAAADLPAPAVEDLRQGYIRLLRRAIPPPRLLAFCLHEAGREPSAGPPVVRAEQIVAAFNQLTRHPTETDPDV